MRGDHKHSACKRGHMLDGRNVVYYDAGTRRECRTCKYRRNSEERKAKNARRKKAA